MDKVLVAMSGGVDSTMTAWLMKKEGYNVTGFHMRLPKVADFFSDDGTRKEIDAHREEAEKKLRLLADKIGIRLVILDMKKEFKDEIVKPFAEGYLRGITPNPCVECNRRIKFGLLLEAMKREGADFLATGHYARIRTTEKNGVKAYEILKAKDTAKDQSYFLYTLTQDQLRHVLFPLGDLTKKDLRRIAEKNGFSELNEESESQDLCFMGGMKTEDFLKKYLPASAFVQGPIITSKGQKIGEHKGLPLYTIGQRKGIGIGGISAGNVEKDSEPWYVVRIDAKNNALMVGTEAELYSNELTVKDLTFVSGETPNGKVDAVIRYRSLPAEAEIKFSHDAGAKGQITAQVIFSEPRRAVSPGQSVVFYEGEKMLGGGVIV